MLLRRNQNLTGSILSNISRCSGKEPALPTEARPDTREPRKLSLTLENLKQSQTKKKCCAFFRSKYEIVPLLHQEIPPQRVTFMEELGRGGYGKVHKAVLTQLIGVEVFFKPKEERAEINEGRIVAVKTLLGTNFTDVALVFLGNEAALGLNCDPDLTFLAGFWARFTQRTKPK